MLLDPGAATSRLSPWAEVGETYDETSFHGHSPYSGCRPCFKDASMTPPAPRRRRRQSGSNGVHRRPGPCGLPPCRAEVAGRRWDEAHRLASRSINVFHEAGAVGYAGPGYVLGLVEVCRGETGHARRRAREWKEQCLAQGNRTYALTNGWVEGLALLLEGNPAAAGLLTELDTFLPKYPEVGVFAQLPDTVEALLLAGRRAEAEDRVQRLSDAARTIENHLWAQATALRCRGLILTAANDHEAATAVLSDATEGARVMGAPLETAQNSSPMAERYAAYDAVRRPASSSRERRHLRRAASTALAPKAIAELRAVPGRGTDRLTPTEKAIAQLAAQGYTNQEIARELVISVKTVEANLTKIYVKLGVRSRTGLARMASND